jgi:hypothetical protein
MSMKVIIEQVWKYILRPESSEIGDALAGHDSLNLEAFMEGICTSTWWP